MLLKDALVKFGLEKFRDPQEEIVRTVLDRKDCMVVMPTGGGKSLCYQLPAILSTGITLVVSPLIALIQDQVSSLVNRGINAASLTSSNTAKEKKKIHEDLAKAKPLLKLLYVTPELLASESFAPVLNKLHERNIVSCLAIDEAHCISSWGHDFRPAYRKLIHFRKKFATVPCIALTATATSNVLKDICEQLDLSKAKIFKRSFNRPNITYYVQSKNRLTSPYEDLKKRLKKISSLCAIVYAHSRKNVDDLCEKLMADKFSCAAYHAGLKESSRSAVLTDWLSGKVSIICATIAFGMGVDKPDVRLVVHWNIPKTMEGFYQESGRAGRDGLRSFSLLYYDAKDIAMFKMFIKKDANKNKIRAKQASDALHAMTTFASIAQCRRKAILKYFGEETNPTNLCKKTCDFCMHPEKVTRHALQSQERGSRKRSSNYMIGLPMKRINNKTLRRQNLLGGEGSNDEEYTRDYAIGSGPAEGFIAVGSSSSRSSSSSSSFFKSSYNFSQGNSLQSLEQQEKNYLQSSKRDSTVRSRLSKKLGF